MANSGTIYVAVNTTNLIYGRMVWTESNVSTANNTSVITVDLQFRKDGYDPTYSDSFCFEIKVNGDSRIIGPVVWSLGAGVQGWTSAFSQSFTITHNADGSKSVSVYGQSWGSGTNGLANADGTGTATLTTIPRASTPTVSPSTAVLGETLTIKTNRASSSFTHNLSYSIDNSTFTSIKTGVGVSYSWSVPKSIASSFPNSTSGNIYIKCETKSGTTSVGTKTITVPFTIPDNSSFRPTVSLSVSPQDTPSAFSGLYVQTLSKVKGTITGTGAYSSTIKSYYATANGQSFSSSSFTSSALTTSGTNTIYAQVTDSRSRTGSASTTINVIPYSVPIISKIDCTQANSKLIVNITGYVAPVNNGSTNKNTLTIGLKYKLHTDSSWTTVSITQPGLSSFNSNGFSTTINNTTDNASYDVQVTLTDAVNVTTKSVRTNLPTKLAKGNRGYITFDSDAKVMLSEYSQSSTYTWGTATTSNLPATIGDCKLSKMHGRMIGYTHDVNLFWSDVNITNLWTTLRTYQFISNMYDCCQARNNVYFLGENSLGYKCVFWLDANMDFQYAKLPDYNVNWNYIAGNEFTIYVIAKDGTVVYSNDTSTSHIWDWKSTTITTAIDGTTGETTGKPLSEFAPLYTSEFIATSNKLIGLVNTDNGVMVIRTPITSYR